MATIRFAEGTSYRVQFTIRDESNDIVTLVGATLTFAAYLPNASKVGTVTPFLSKTIGSGIEVYDLQSGQVVVVFYPHETDDKAGVYEWELELVELNGDTWMAGSGPLIIQPGRRLDK